MVCWTVGWGPGLSLEPSKKVNYLAQRFWSIELSSSRQRSLDKMNTKCKQSSLSAAGQLFYCVTTTLTEQETRSECLWGSPIDNRPFTYKKKLCETTVSNGLGVMMFWRSGGKGLVTHWLNQLMNDEAVCITAVATQGLLLIFVWPVLSLRFYVYFHFLVGAELHIIEDSGNVSFAKILLWKDISIDYDMAC